MGKLAAIFTLVSLLLAPAHVFAADNHAAHRGSVAHEEVVDGVKATFMLTRIADELKAKGVVMPKGLRETHHLAAEFKDAKSGRSLVKGLVAVRMQGPGQVAEPQELVGMDGHFGLDLDLSRPGKYGITCRFVLEDGKKRQVRFWYEIK